MKHWLIYSSITLILWGLWGFLIKTSSQQVPEKTLLLLGSLGFALTFPIVFALFPGELTFNIKNINYYTALFSGLLGGIGVVFYYRAVSIGDSSKVVVFTAMYPLITVLLSVFILNETLTLYKTIGIVCALLAAVLLSL